MIIRNKLFLFLVILISSTILKNADAICQDMPIKQTDSTKYSIGLGIGVNDFHIKDDYLSPYYFSGLMFSARINFKAIISNSRHEVFGYFSSGSPESDKQTFEIRQKTASLTYSFFHNFSKLDIAGSPCFFLVGAGLSTFVTNSDLVLKSKSYNGVFTDQSWYWSHSVNLLTCGDYHVSEKTNLTVKLNMPFFKVASRPENGHWLDGNNSKVVYDNFFNAAKGGKGEFLWDNLVVLCDVEFIQKINERFSFHGSYGFNFTSSDRPFAMDMFMNNLLIGLDLSL